MFNGICLGVPCASKIEQQFLTTTVRATTLQSFMVVMTDGTTVLAKPSRIVASDGKSGPG